MLNFFLIFIRLWILELIRYTIYEIEEIVGRMQNDEKLCLIFNYRITIRKPHRFT